jgi:acetylglutamate kinase
VVERAGELKGQVVVIRLSSKVIEDAELFDHFADNIKTLADCGIKVFIVHDYTTLLPYTIDRFGTVNSQYVSYINNEKTAEIAEMVLSGHVNKQVVSILCSKGLRAIGLSGKDGNLITAKYSQKSLAISGMLDYSLYVSDPLLVFPEILFELEDTNIVTIISPIAFNERGKTCILNIDSTSSMLASTIEADHLFILCKLEDNKKSFITVREREELRGFEIYSDLQVIDESLIKAAEYVVLNSSGIVHFVNEQVADSVLDALFC